CLELPSSAMFSLPVSLAFSVVFCWSTFATEIHTLSLHDALPISKTVISKIVSSSLSEEEFASGMSLLNFTSFLSEGTGIANSFQDRKSTRLNSSHDSISYAVFCLKNKNSTSPLLSTACPHWVDNR